MRVPVSCGSRPLAERLTRLGYNALRIHHYERDLVRANRRPQRSTPKSWSSSTFSCRFDPARNLPDDRPVCRAACRGGKWALTRRADSDGHVQNPGAGPRGRLRDWRQFTRALLDHTNPTRSAATPTSRPWRLSAINEAISAIFTGPPHLPEWTSPGTNGSRAATRRSVSRRLGKDLKARIRDNSVALPENLRDGGSRARLHCLPVRHRAGHGPTDEAFLRDELGCRALVSNANSWTCFVTDQSARAAYDYVDDHFYVDHPQFLQGSWRLPSKCPNTSPIADGATGGRSKTFTRLFDKPFTITEYNYSGPGRFRGVGGILTGAMGALQGWGGIWRFAYSHSREAMFTPSRMGYFDLASDPLSQAAERASLCLFLRGDLQAAPPCRANDDRGRSRSARRAHSQPASAVALAGLDHAVGTRSCLPLKPRPHAILPLAGGLPRRRIPPSPSCR